MKEITFVTLFLFISVLSAAPQVTGQTTGNTTPGPVWRVQYLRVLPGKMNDVLMDLRKNLRPIYDEAKKQGVIVEYKIYTNQTQSGSDDWNLALAVAYKNWGGIDDSTARFNAISLKHYGSQGKLDEAAANRRQLSSGCHQVAARADAESTAVTFCHQQLTNRRLQYSGLQMAPTRKGTFHRRGAEVAPR